MSSPLWKRLQLLVSVLSVILLLVGAGLGFGWWYLRGSLPRLDGKLPLSGLRGSVRIDRDALGVPTITAESRVDLSRATGFVHAQDRFFQMDLLRRSGAGELAEIFGPEAVPLDQAHRLHGFRRTAEKALGSLDPEKRAVLEAYTAGVNAGLAALKRKPWEYLALRIAPQPWRPEDSFLVIYSMWFELQDSVGRHEQSLDALRRTVGQSSLDFLSPRGNSWDAALDGSLFTPAPLPSVRMRPADVPGIPGKLTESMPSGSNAFALAGVHTANGSAMLASDMHLRLNIPHIWYRAVLRWSDPAGVDHRLVGVTLPGTPSLVAGSNGRIAWGYSNAYVDTTDVVVVETENIAQAFYRTAHGYTEIEDRPDPIKVKGAETIPFTAQWTEWGPIISGPVNGIYKALRWNAHEPESTNLNLLELETAESVAAAMAIAHRSGMPNQNLVVADRNGHIAWTVTGRIPRRVGYDGRVPVAWGYGDRRWDGWLSPSEVPMINDPAEGILWTANNRLVGGEAYTKLGDGGYDDGPRAKQIRDDLRSLVSSGKKIAPSDLLAVQLDDRALFLERWQKFLLEVLTDDAVAQNRARADLRDAVRQWNGRAEVDSAAYRLVRTWRLRVAEHTLAPFFAAARASFPAFNYQSFLFGDALWQLVHEQPARLLNPVFPSWSALLLASADDVLAEADRAGVAAAQLTWGTRNTLRMQHPFSRFLPSPLTRWLDMPKVQLPGGADMPRVQSASFGASERMVVSPGHEEEGIYHMPGGQSGHPLSPYYRAGHEAWVRGDPTPLMPGPPEHTLLLLAQ